MSNNKRLRKAARASIKANVAQYPTDGLVSIPRTEWPNACGDSKRLNVWCSRYFLVQSFQESAGIIRLSVTKNQIGFGQRTFADGISWDELQLVKRQAGYGNRQAVEIYPEDDLVVNDCNMRHLWLLPEPIEIGWR